MTYPVQRALRVVAIIAVCQCATVALAQSPQPTTEDFIDTIVVVGTHTSIEAAREEAALTPGGVNLIDLNAYRDRNVSSLADVVRYAPGVWATSDSGTDDIFFSSRGSNLDATDYDMNGIKLLQDGLPVTTADGNNHNRIIDPLSARHATIARGANAMKYGASTLGGAINFVSRTARDISGVDLSLSGGSFGQALARVTVASEFSERFDGLLTVESKQWDGYRRHNEQNRLGIYANSGWQVSDNVATRFYAMWLQNDQELAGSLSRAQAKDDPDQANASAIGGNFQLDVEAWRLANKTNWQIDDNRRLEFGVSLEEQTLFHPIVDRVMVDFDGPGPAPPVEVFSLLINTDHRDIGAMFRYQHTIGRHELVAGVNAGRNDVEGGNYRNLGGMPNGLSTEIDNDATALEVFVMDRWQLSDRLTLVAAAQGVSARRNLVNRDVASGDLSNPSDRYSGINPRLGIVYDLNDKVTLYANASRTYEPPTNFELQDNVAGGNATLDAMHGLVFEVGTRGDRPFGRQHRWGWDVSLYRAAIEDEILSVEDPAAPGTSLVTNVDNTAHAGIEAMIDARFQLGDGDHAIEPLVSVTLNDFRFDDDPVYAGNRLPAAPTYAVQGEIMYRSEHGYYFGPTFEMIGKRYADFENSYRIEDYSLIGLRSGWANNRWSVFADIANLLDEDYVANHSVRNVAAESDAILNPGSPRSVFVGVRRRFD